MFRLLLTEPMDVGPGILSQHEFTCLYFLSNVPRPQLSTSRLHIVLKVDECLRQVFMSSCTDVIV